ncbi:hypothetical protein niasHS_010288 [Heterodera schachtii]|uniref:Btz domain-containing protein n=1 Tax=Heterodera schachtii TaxID=97005 RepID=A0ABD2IZA5_HETSC
MTSQGVENYLKDQTTSDIPTIAEGFQNLMNLYINKLWDQLSAEASQLVRNKLFVSTVNLSQFYEEFVRDFERRIEPLQLIELITPIAEDIFERDRQSAYTFLDNFDKVIKQDKRAIVRLQASKIQLRLRDKPTAEAKCCNDPALVRKMLEETKTMVDKLVEVGSVHAAYYGCSAEYQFQMGDHDRYYEEALHYLGCEDINVKLSAEQKRQQAEKISISALLGENVYNFGELLAHPILNDLSDTPNAWLSELLHAVNVGDWDGFLKHKEKLVAAYSEAGEKIEELERKLRLQCLIEEEEEPRRRKGAEDEQEDEQEGEEEDEQEEEEEELDEDECKDSPAYIPKQGRFYMHDEASARSVIVEHTSLFAEETEKGEEGQSTGGATQLDTAREPKTRADRVGRWKHDMFREREQAPKSSRELFMRYGQDIRQQKGEEEDNQETERWLN